MEQENLWGKADGSKSHTAFIPVIELPRIPAECLKYVPKNILERTKENMEVYNLSLTDAFQEATRSLAKKGTELWKAWYYDDFRAYVPCIYDPKYLDLSK